MLAYSGAHTGSGSVRRTPHAPRRGASAGRLPAGPARAGVLHGVAARHGVVAQHVAGAQQVASVAVERRVGCRVREQRQDGAAHALQRPRRAPRVLQNVQANLAGLHGADGVSTTRSNEDVRRGRRPRALRQGRGKRAAPSSARWGGTPAAAWRERAHAMQARPRVVNTCLRHELDRRRRQRVLLRHVDSHLKRAALVRRADRALQPLRVKLLRRATRPPRPVVFACRRAARTCRYPVHR